jgi:hypothetical protein
LCPSGMLMGANDGALDVVQIPVELPARLGWLLDGVKHVLPEAGPLPAVEGAGHGAPGAIALGQIAPGGPGAQNPEHAIKDAAMVHGRPASRGFLGWEQRPQSLPLGVG